jgi:hypothetical protein
MKTKQTKVQRIVELERKLREAEAGQAHVYHFASQTIDKASTNSLMGSGVIITLTVLGGREIFDPVMIRNGLSKETIEALKADFVRSYEDAVEFKPKGAK